MRESFVNVIAGTFELVMCTHSQTDRSTCCPPCCLPHLVLRPLFLDLGSKKTTTAHARLQVSSQPVTAPPTSSPGLDLLRVKAREHAARKVGSGSPKSASPVADRTEPS
ncbi:hypothetical protein MRX96_043515 [Rhipicephalus microplus]